MRNNPGDIALEAESAILFSLPGFDGFARQTQYAGFKGLNSIIGELRRDFLDDLGNPKKIRLAPSRKLMDQGEVGWKKFVTGWVMRDLQDSGRNDVVGMVEEASTRYVGLVDSTAGSIGVDTESADKLIEDTVMTLGQVMKEKGVPMGQLPESNVLDDLFEESTTRVWKSSAFKANPNVGVNLRELGQSYSGLLGEISVFTQVLGSAQSVAGR